MSDPRGRLLVIQRGTAPGRGLWSVPGGRCRPGESSAAACEREVLEETGLRVRAERLAGSVERDGPGEVVYAIDDYVCVLLGGELAAGDDAADARWVDRAEFAALPLTAGLWDALADWDMLPA